MQHREFTEDTTIELEPSLKWTRTDGLETTTIARKIIDKDPW